MEKLLRKLWLSADFESDFSSDWKTAYELLEKGETLQGYLLEMCLLYLNEWEEKQQAD